MTYMATLGAGMWTKGPHPDPGVIPANHRPIPHCQDILGMRGEPRGVVGRRTRTEVGVP